MQVRSNCRKCKKKTIHITHIVTDNLPPDLKVVQCVECEVMGIARVEDLDADL